MPGQAGVMGSAAVATYATKAALNVTGPATVLGGYSDEFREVVEQPRLRPGADELLDDLPVLEDTERRDVEDPILPRDLWVLVDVQLDDVDLVAVFRQDRLQHRGYLPAGAAPLGPVVHEHGPAVLEDIGLEAVVGYLLHLAHARFLPSHHEVHGVDGFMVIDGFTAVQDLRLARYRSASSAAA